MTCAWLLNARSVNSSWQRATADSRSITLRVARTCIGRVRRSSSGSIGTCSPRITELISTMSAAFWSSVRTSAMSSVSSVSWMRALCACISLSKVLVLQAEIAITSRTQRIDGDYRQLRDHASPITLPSVRQLGDRGERDARCEVHLLEEVGGRRHARGFGELRFAPFAVEQILHGDIGAPGSALGARDQIEQQVARGDERAGFVAGTLGDAAAAQGDEALAALRGDTAGAHPARRERDRTAVAVIRDERCLREGDVGIERQPRRDVGRAFEIESDALRGSGCL